MFVLRNTVLLYAVHTFLLTTGYGKLTTQLDYVAHVVGQIADELGVKFYQVC